MYINKLEKEYVQVCNTTLWAVNPEEIEPLLALWSKSAATVVPL